MSMEKWADAEGALLDGLKLQPDDPELLTALAVVALRRGERTRARALVDDVLTRDPFHSEAQLLAGELRQTASVAELAAVSTDATHLRLGAGTTVDRAWAELVSYEPGLARMARRFAGPAVRGTGTVGGNLVNASPIADLVPVLVALDAEVVVAGPQGTRTVAVDGFATGVRRTVLEAGEVVVRVDVPLASFARSTRAYKVSRRFDDDISTVSAVVGIEQHGGRIDDVRVVLGGVATTVVRARAVERALLGRTWDAETLRAAQAAVGSDATPISDHRASASYRDRAVRGLLQRWWYETGHDAPTADVDVWGGR